MMTIGPPRRAKKADLDLVDSNCYLLGLVRCPCNGTGASRGGPTTTTTLPDQSHGLMPKRIQEVPSKGGSRSFVCHVFQFA